MANGNSVTVVGNLTDDPDLRFTSGGAAMARFGVAVNRRWQNRQSGQWEEEASFFNVVAWREMAENISNSLQKGQRVVVTGWLQQRNWENQQGEKRTSVEIQAEEIGPSLRFATAQVQRRPREDGGRQNGGEVISGARQPAKGTSGGFPEEQPWDDEPAF